MINYTEIIAKYIAGELSETDKATFEKELNTNADLKKEYDLQLQIIDGAKRLGLKNQVSSSFKTVWAKAPTRASVTESGISTHCST